MTYPVRIGNMDGTTSSRAIQSDLLTHWATILYSIKKVSETKAKDETDTHTDFSLRLNRMIHPTMQSITLKIPQIIHKAEHHPFTKSHKNYFRCLFFDSIVTSFQYQYR